MANRNITCVRRYRNVEITTMLCDLTTLNVDVIVCPSNEYLTMGGGVSGAIARRGGNQIQAECEAYLRQRRLDKLPFGEVFMSGAGDLQCKKIIHAVGPRWMGGNQNEDNDLYDAVFTSLSEADKYGCTSFGLPPISAGVYGFPLDKCVEIIMEAIHTYLEETPSTSLRNIFLVSINQGEVNELTKGLQQLFADT